MLMALENHNARMAMTASPAPRNTALLRKMRKIVVDPPNKIAKKGAPATTPGVAPIHSSIRGAIVYPKIAGGIENAAAAVMACPAA